MEGCDVTDQQTEYWFWVSRTWQTKKCPLLMGLTHHHLSNEKISGCLGYIGDYTPHLYWDYNEP